jgi:uncharacterized protein (TIGR01777 family)
VPSPFTRVERQTRLPVPVDDAFAWHTRPGALERLAPPWEHLEVLERQGGIEEGGRSVLRVGIGPLRTRWVAVHRDYEAGRQFADEQEEGPFPFWRHLHRFEPAGPDASVAIDRVEYSPPFGTLGAAAELVARPRIERMLDYRHRLLRADLAAHAAFRDHPRLHVAITGASGLLGTGLTHFLTTGGHRVTPITRARSRPGSIQWDPGSGTIDRAALEGIDAVVHLAGETVGRRWTPERKRRIRESRVGGTRLLAEALAGMARPPRVLVSASGVGAYGDRGNEILTEASTLDAPPDFFVQLAREWEAATEPVRAAGVRVVIARMGVVLTPAGGALQRMLPPFRLGVGGPLGSGRQWLSWVAMDDALGALHHALMSDRLSGPVNVTAPEPVRGADFARTLGRVLGRPALFPVPAAALRLLFGEMADVALLSSQRALPARLSEAGYGFRYAGLEGALRHVLGR